MYVHYYRYITKTIICKGWKAIANTHIVPTTMPTKADVICNNTLISQEKRLINARYIYNYLITRGWSNTAILGMLGNMKKESSINPGKWEEYNNLAKGFGLTHWTASAKLTSWAAENGLDPYDIDTQLQRILHEGGNENLQWMPANHTPEISFKDYTTSSNSVGVLAEYFLRCYEHREQWSSSKHTPQMTFVEYHQSTKSISTLAEYFVRCYEHPDVFINGTASEQAATILARQKKALKWSALLDNLV